MSTPSAFDTASVINTNSDRAQTLAQELGAVSHRVVDINLAQFGGSALIDRAIDVPKSDSVGRNR